MTPTPMEFNDQHVWGGPTYKQESFEANTWNNVNPHASKAFAASSQVGIIASNSDDLFLPSNNVVSYPYTLPDIPFNTTYNHSFSHHLSRLQYLYSCEQSLLITASFHTTTTA
jgi:hypothetical protein